MRITKILSILALVLLACQMICGFYLANNPESLVQGRNDFHMTLGIAIFCVGTTATVGLFLVAEKK